MPCSSVTISFCSRAALQNDLHVDQEISLPICTSKTLRTGFDLTQLFSEAFMSRGGFTVTLSQMNAAVCPFQGKAESCFALKITSRNYSIPKNIGAPDSAPAFV